MTMIKSARDVVAEILSREWFSVAEDVKVRMASAVQAAMDEVRADECKACAEVCDELRVALERRALKVDSEFRETLVNGMASGAGKCTTLIRARGLDDAAT